VLCEQLLGSTWKFSHGQSVEISSNMKSPKFSGVALDISSTTEYPLLKSIYNS